jgi:hypothetical protein
MVELQITFSSRTPGSFGNTAAGRIAEWLTKTWLRFTCALISSMIIIVVLVSQLPLSEKVPLLLSAPIIAVIYWYMFLCLLLVCRYLGWVGRVFGSALVIYFFLFSRFVVQRPPKVWLPLMK